MYKQINKNTKCDNARSPKFGKIHSKLIFKLKIIKLIIGIRKKNAVFKSKRKLPNQYFKIHNRKGVNIKLKFRPKTKENGEFEDQ